MIQYLLCLIFPVIFYSLQTYPRVFNRYFGVDVWTLLIEAKLVRENHHRIPMGKITSGFIFDGYFDYPPIYILFLSLFSEKKLFQLQGFISPFFDVIQNIVTFLIALQLTGDIRIALFAQLLYTFTPVSALENSALTPRSWGYLCFTLTFYFLLLFSNSHPTQVLYLFMGLLFTVITLLSHKFATQSLFFISVVFTFIEKTPLYLLVFLFGIIIATIVSKGYYLRVFKSHVNIIYFWFKNYKYRYVHPVYGEHPKSKKFDLLVLLYSLLSKFAPITLLLSNIWLISGFVILFFNLPAPAIFTKMAIWIISFYLLAILLLMVKILTPIGEGYRYLEMTPVPATILSSYIFFHYYQTPLRIPVIIIYSLLILANIGMVGFFQMRGIIKDKNRSLTNTMDEVFTYINKLKGTPRIMCIPHQITTMVIYKTKADVLVNFDAAAFLKMHDFFPILRKSVREIMKKYNIDYLLLREDYVPLKDLHLKKPVIVFRSADVILVKTE